MNRFPLAVFGLLVIALLTNSVSSVAQPGDTAPTLLGDLQTGKRYHVVRAGKDYNDSSTLVELIAVDKDWIKVKLLGVENRIAWINLQQVGAIKLTGGQQDERRPEADK